MARRYPALDIHFAADAERTVELRDMLVAGLDDFQPTAIEESTTSWRVFFDVPERRERALAWMRSLGDPRVTVEPLDLEDGDWARRSQSDLQPVRIGTIVVAPPWSAARADAAPDSGVSDLRTSDALLIVIVPSTGFGTGHHASTRLCLTLLQEIAVRDRTVLDIGTGSGVLAIAAARLGARTVVALDNDPDAIEAVRENVRLNGVGASLTLRCADFRTTAPAQADIILANLTGDLLRRSAASLVACANRPGDLVLSGVLAEEQSVVVAAFEAAGARLQTSRSEDEWVGLHLKT
jgi:ribosomal protein L11 methyltransferase